MHYPVSNNKNTLAKTRSFLDWMKGLTEKQIASRPNRYIYIPCHQLNVPDHLKEFVGGGYTDDNC